MWFGFSEEEFLKAAFRNGTERWCWVLKQSKESGDLSWVADCLAWIQVA